MDAQIAYKLLGALATFGLGWKRVSAAYASLSKAEGSKDLFKLKEQSIRHLALEIQAPGSSPAQKNILVNQVSTAKLVEAMKMALEKKEPKQAGWWGRYKSSVKASVLFTSALLVYLNVLPAARSLNPNSPDIGTYLIASGAVYGLLAGFAVCTVYKLLHFFFSRWFG